MALIYHIIALLGGLAMFLYGMRVMGDGLKSNSGGAMKNALAKVTTKPFLGFLLGCLVTCVIQSSTATIVLTVGLVGAGFLTFSQSVGIVLGANVGTAITAQIIRLMDIDSAEGSLLYFFKADNLAPLALVIGIVILMTAKRESKKNIGNVACGFGVLFMGLIFMSDAVNVFKESLIDLLTAFSNNYLLGFGSGVIVTGVIQSSSAVVGIIQSVASSVGVSFNGVFAVIIGVNIGDCLTTYLVSRIGARPEQIRTAVVHVVYNMFAALLIILLLTIGRSTGILNDEFWFRELDSGGVANVHGLFRIIPAIILLPLSKVLEKITRIIVKDQPAQSADEEKNFHALDSRLIISPILALDQVDGLIVHMSEIAYSNYEDCIDQVFHYDEAKHKLIHEREDSLDQMTDEIGQYLVNLTPYIKRNRDLRTQNFQMKSSVCFERIGDCCMNIVISMKNLKNCSSGFSEAANAEIQILMDAVREIMKITLEAYKTKDDTLADRIEPLEEVVDDLAADLNTRHVYRMANHLCDAVRGLQFENVVSKLSIISDQCSDISIYIKELKEEEIRGREHEYIHKLHHSVNSQFQKYYMEERERYYSRLMEIPMPSVLDKPE